MGLYPVAVCYNATQYNTIQYDKITHITQNYMQRSRQPSISKISKKKKNQELCLRGEWPAADLLGHGTAFEG